MELDMMIFAVLTISTILADLVWRIGYDLLNPAFKGVLTGRSK